MNREFAFDVKLAAVARVRAGSEAEARALLRETLQAVDVGFSEGAVSLTEASLDDGHPFLFEDGEVGS